MTARTCRVARSRSGNDAPCSRPRDPPSASMVIVSTCGGAHPDDVGTVLLNLNAVLAALHALSVIQFLPATSTPMAKDTCIANRWQNAFTDKAG